MAQCHGTVTPASEFERYRARRQQRSLPFSDLRRPVMAWMPDTPKPLAPEAVAHRARMLGHLTRSATDTPTRR
jgi:hypothetical protein